MAAAFVSERASAHHASGVTSLAVTITAGTQGNLLVVLVTTQAITNTFTVPTDNGTGSAWQNDVVKNGANTNQGVLIASTILGSSPPTTVTINGLASGAGFAYKIIEFSGIASASWFDVGTSTQQSASTTVSVGAITPALANELIVVVISSAAAQSAFTQGTNYTQSGTPTNSSGTDIVAEYRLVGTTSETAGGTMASALTTAAWGAIASYKLPVVSSLAPSKTNFIYLRKNV